MPFKIVQVINEKNNQPELCICPSAWEERGILCWPIKKSKKLSRIENSIPQPDWPKMGCKVKRQNILTYEMGNKLLNEMLECCSTTEQEIAIELPVAAATEQHKPNFNHMAEQATFFEIPPELNTEPFYNIEVDESTPVIVTNTSLFKIETNQIEICQKQEEILNNQKVLKENMDKLKENYEKSLENQKNIMKTIAEISVKLDLLITKNSESSEVTTLNEIKISQSNTLLRPIQNFEELCHFENELNEINKRQEYKLKYSIVCQPGKATNCAYQLIDVFFNRNFLTLCSWSGSARGEGTKIGLKVYKNILNLFFEIIYECDRSYTIAANDVFFKSILKNATKRSNSKLQRTSTSRISIKRQKTCEETKENQDLTTETVLINRE